jgi:hypothetical protein
MDGPYSKRDIHRAVNASAVLGWVAVTVWSLGGNWPLYFYAALFGLPIAFAASWLIGAPVLRRVMRRTVTYPRAALFGGVIAAVMALASIAIGRYMGWRQSADDMSWSQIGGGDFIREVDGILTPYGWWIVGQNSLILIVLGAGIGVVIRAWIGPGRE